SRTAVEKGGGGAGRGGRGWLTGTEAAAKAKVGEKTIKRWVRAGRLRPYRTGRGRAVISTAELAAVALPPAPMLPLAGEAPAAAGPEDREGLRGRALRHLIELLVWVAQARPPRPPATAPQSHGQPAA